MNTGRVLIKFRAPDCGLENEEKMNRHNVSQGRYTRFHALHRFHRRECDDCQSLPCYGHYFGLKYGGKRMVVSAAVVRPCGPVSRMGNDRPFVGCSQLRFRGWGARVRPIGPFTIGSPMVACIALPGVRILLRSQRGGVSRPRIQSVVFQRSRHSREFGNGKRLIHPRFDRMSSASSPADSRKKAEMPLT